MFDEALAVIRDSISDHRQITFVTEDEAGILRTRIVCVHILGTKRGARHFLAWQVNDDSQNGFWPGKQRWRCFDVGNISEVAFHEGAWHRGWTTGRGRQTCIDDVDTMVDELHGAQVIEPV